LLDLLQRFPKNLILTQTVWSNNQQATTNDQRPANQRSAIQNRQWLYPISSIVDLRISFTGRRSSETPRSQHHGLAGAGSGLQDRFYATYERDYGAGAGRRAFCGQDYDCVAFVQIGHGNRGRAAQHLLKV
jgi:hypothetical protein